MVIKINGADKLKKDLREMQKMTLIKEGIKHYTAKMDTEVVRRAYFVKGYSVGFTRRSVVPEIKNNRMVGCVKTTSEYSGYVEVGTRFMEAQPFVKPAFELISADFINFLRRIT